MADDGTGPFPEPIAINIGNICGGALLELFDLGMAQMMANIYDMSTSAKAKRTMTLTIELKPRDNRLEIVAEVSSKVSPAPANSKINSIFVATDEEGTLYALDRDPRQIAMFQPPKPTEAPKPIQFRATQK